MRIVQKLHSRAGFTLGETLVAMLILLMVTAVVAGGIPVARNAYEKVVRAANAQVLLSTTVTSLRSELGTSRDVQVEDGTISYSSAGNGARSKLFQGETGVIMVQDFLGFAGAKGSEARLLVTEKAATEDLYVSYESVQYDDAVGLLTFAQLTVKDGNGHVWATLDSFVIRVVTA